MTSQFQQVKFSDAGLVAMEERTLGSTTWWFCGRLWELIMVILFANFGLIVGGGALVVSIVVAGMLVVLLDSLAVGTAGEGGIAYRRYFRRHFVPWSEVRSVEWPYRDLLGVSQKMGYRIRFTNSPRPLYFPLNPSVTEAISIRYRGAIPEVILWLNAKLESARSEVRVLPIG